MKSVFIFGSIAFLFFAVQSCGERLPVSTLLITPPSLDSFDCKTSDCVYYRVNNHLYPLKQPTKNSCWATVLTMLLSWKEQKLLNIDQVVSRFGKNYESLLARSAHEGISITDEIELYKKADLGIMRQLSPSIEGWEYFLQQYGPLSVTVDAKPPYGGTVHAILVTGIYGRKDATDTMLSYIDPLTGAESMVNFMVFIKMYEAKYSVDWQIQVIHNNKDSISQQKPLQG